MNVPPADLRALVEPGSVAVVGASEDPTRIGGLVLKHLRESFQGALYAVNPSRATVQGIPSVSTPHDLPDAVDLAVVAVPASAAVRAVQDIAERGVRSAVVLTSGFAETVDGANAQARMLTAARAHGLRLVGPNCAGLISRPGNLVATFARHPPRPRTSTGLAVVSQSGAVGMTLFNRLDAAGCPADIVVTTGNEVDLTVSDVLEHVVARPDVRAVLMFVEGVAAPDVLVRAGQAAAGRGVPVVMLKAGATIAGAAAALSHTASVAAPDSAISALLRRAGILRVDRLDDLVDLAPALARGHLPGGPRLAMMTNSGGMGVVMADAAVRAGLQVARFSPTTTRALDAIVPSFGSTANPVDVTANIINDPEAFGRIVDIVTDSGEMDALVVSGVTDHTLEARAAVIENAATRSGLPVVVSAGSTTSAVALNRRGIPAVTDPTAAVHVVGALHRMAGLRGLGGLAPVDVRERCGPGPTRTLGSAAAADLLHRYGIPLVPEEVVHGRDQALSAAARLGYPVAVKVDASTSAHKTEIGGVVLDVATPDALERSVVGLADRTSQDPATVPLVVQVMRRSALELVVGAVRHRELGLATVSVGLGGTLVEVLDEVATDVVPVSLDAATSLVQGLCGGRLVSSARGLLASQVPAVARMVLALSALVMERADIVEVDLNPVVLDGRRAIALDHLVVVES